MEDALIGCSVAKEAHRDAVGFSHLRIKRGASGYLTELLSTPPVNRHRPSVDVLFDSAAELVGRNAIGVILTGMGKDGACGLLRMRTAGARTFGQDEASCVVYGMPREAAMIGAVALPVRWLSSASMTPVGTPMKLTSGFEKYSYRGQLIVHAFAYAITVR